MVEDYKVLIRRGSSELTGDYEITRRGTRRAETRFVERYKTPAGIFLPEEWKKKALEAIETEGETELLESIKAYCKKHCVWLRREKELEEYAISCLCSRAYKHWKDFETEPQQLGFNFLRTEGGKP